MTSDKACYDMKRLNDTTHPIEESEKYKSGYDSEINNIKISSSPIIDQQNCKCNFNSDIVESFQRIIWTEIMYIRRELGIPLIVYG